MSKDRAAVWESAEAEGHGRVLCNLCSGEVLPGDDWDISHGPIPKVFGGKRVAVAHRRCNRLDNIEYVTPAAALVRRKRRRHFGVTGPGLGDNPLPAGRRSSVTKKLNGKVEPRLTQAQKHRRTMAALYPFGRSE